MNQPYRPTALVTGGSKGIGLELAREFARHDHDLILVARDEQALAQAATSIRKTTPAEVTTYALDLNQPVALEELFRKLMGTRVDVLVNNAGRGDHGDFARSDIDQQMKMLTLNMLTLTRLTHHFLQPMLARAGGALAVPGRRAVDCRGTAAPAIRTRPETV